MEFDFALPGPDLPGIFTRFGMRIECHLVTVTLFAIVFHYS